jgi:hypothetical protein
VKIINNIMLHNHEISKKETVLLYNFKYGIFKTPFLNFMSNKHMLELTLNFTPVLSNRLVVCKCKAFLPLFCGGSLFDGGKKKRFLTNQRRTLFSN